MPGTAPLDPDRLRAGDELRWSDGRGVVVFEVSDWDLDEGSASGGVIHSEHPNHPEGASFTCDLGRAAFEEGCFVHGPRSMSRVDDGAGGSMLVCGRCEQGDD